jgi:hypothetical protein
MLNLHRNKEVMMKRLFSFLIIPLVVMIYAASLNAVPYVSGGGGGSTTAADIHLDDLLTAVGIASEATHMGTFTGATIADNQTAKAALQALETSLELKATAANYLPLAGGTMVGNLLFTDNTYDIGASGATRPRTGYFGTSVVAPVGTFSGAVTAASFSSNKASGVAGLISVYEALTTSTLYQGWMGAADLTGNRSYAFQFGNAEPAAGQVMAFAAPTGTGDPNGNPVSAQTWVLPALSPAGYQVSFTGPTAARSYALPDAAATLARTDAGQTFTGVNIFTAPTFTTSITPTSAGASTLGTAALEWGHLYLTDSAVIYGQADQSNSITSAATGWTFAKPVTIATVTDDNYIKIINNSARTPTASVNELYPEANVWKVNQNGTESSVVISPSAGQASLTGLTAPRAYSIADRAGRVHTSGAALTTLTPSAAVSLDVTLNDTYKLTVTDAEASTITFSAAGNVGQNIKIIFVTAGTSTEVVTFHATLVSSTGTLTLGTDAGKYYVVSFLSDGTRWYEVSRTAVQT